MQFQTVSHWDLDLLLRLGQPASAAPKSLLKTILIQVWGTVLCGDETTRPEDFVLR